ncbi:hypothetical protein [Pseudomonas viridiflava]|uniref:hypothetical protein n=1 Tax=Pseudomonas viridiflava TaxID=33069 RepID=UPI001BCCFB4D|nr:hypothetical protein [Pseudomonas viridiflava]QVI88025.1 hypothetical protein KHW14_12025 [Pseudomonas viridiflava]
MTMTRTHQAFFSELVEKLFRQGLEAANQHTDVDYILSLIDFKDYGKRFGEEVLKHASYSDLKHADKVLSDERVIRSTYALEQALACIAPTTDDAKSVEVMAQYLTSGALDAETALNGIADVDDATQTRALQLIQERKNG